MQVMNIILNFIEVLAILGLIFISKYYLSSYMKEKAKNLATKEDISDITSKIESVKIEYLKESGQFKTELNKDLELLKISHTSLQANKVQYFTELINHLNEVLTQSGQQRKHTSKQNQEKYQKKATLLFAKLFLFASDDTIKKWVKIRETPTEKPYQKALIVMFADFILSLRKDIGYSETKCN